MRRRDEGPQEYTDQPQMPPSDTVAEAALLGAMLMDPMGACGITDRLEMHAEMFYRPAHRVVFEAIQRLRVGPGDVDEMNVVNELRATDGGKQGGVQVTALAAAGGASEVLSLAERCPVVANAQSYAAAVIEAYTKRRQVEIGHAVAKAGYDPTMLSPDAVRYAEQQLLELVKATGEKHQRGDAVDTTQSMEAWSAAYERRSDAELREQDTVSWGRPELDDRMGRMQPGQVFVISGWTKMGKSWQVIDIAEAAMEQGHRVLIDSGEMSDEEIVDRWIAMGGHNYTAVQEGRIPWSVMEKRRREIQKWDRRVLSGRMSIQRLRSQVSRAKLEGRAFRVVVVDHLGLVRPGAGEGRNGRREFIEDAVAELKAMAEEYGFTLLLVCQLKRPAPTQGAHDRYLRPPIQSDLKEASGIEQIATSVMFVYRRMEKATGRFDGQRAVLLFPFHRSRPTPEPLPCEFVLPARPGAMSGSAYRFEPVVTTPSEPSPAIAAVQESIEGTFGPVTTMQDDDTDSIPF